MQRLLKILLGVCLFFVVSNLPNPLPQSPLAMQTLGIFSATITLVLLGALPLGASTLLALIALVALKIKTFQQAFAGYHDPVAWLVWSAFFVATAIIQTGLGSRISNVLIKFFGKSVVRLGYCFSFTDVLIAPVIPSVTARSGGIVYPIVRSALLGMEAKGHPSPKISAFMILLTFQSTVISSAMFLTAMAANPLSVRLATSIDIDLSWGEWFKMAVVPGVLSLMLMPWLIGRWLGINKDDDALLVRGGQTEARPKPFTRKEIITCVVFVSMIVCWGLGQVIDLNPTLVGLCGVMIFIISGVLQWDDIIKNKEAWDTLIWFGGLITLAQAINDTGLTSYLGDLVANNLSGFSVYTSFFLLYCIYFFSHYFFASSTAHVSAMFLPFLVASVKIGFPPKLAVFLLATAGSLFGCLTHYGNGAAPLLYATGAVSMKRWWSMGLAFSLLYIALWCVIPLTLYSFFD